MISAPRNRCHCSRPDCAARPHQEGNTALHNAANSGHVNVVSLLLQHGAKLEARTQARALASGA